MASFLSALEMVLDEIQGENRVKGRIFRLGRFEQICQQEKKRGVLWREQIEDKRSNGSQILSEGRKGSRVQVGGCKATRYELGGKDRLFKKVFEFFLK